MALGGSIRRRDRKPLGDAEGVKSRIIEAFPGVDFLLITEPEAWPAPNSILLRLVSSLWKTRYPHWEGHFEGEEYIAAFQLDAGYDVKVVDVTLYGRGTPNAVGRFDALSERTGWRVKFR